MTANASLPIIEVIFDHAGFGTDGQVWGGEFLISDSTGFHRAAHLQSVPLPAGEKASLQPWHMAYSHLNNADLNLNQLVIPLSPEEKKSFELAFFRDPLPILTSSMGKLFDAVSAILGLCIVSTYEGEALSELENLANLADDDFGSDYEFLIFEKDLGWILDPALVLAQIQQDLYRRVSPASIAKRFHWAVAELVVRVCKKIRDLHELNHVLLGGALFANKLLDRETRERLAKAGFILESDRSESSEQQISLKQLTVMTTIKSKGLETHL